MHANIWNIKLNDLKNAAQWRENMENSMDIANKLIGRSKASDITTDASKRIRAFQSNQEAYVKEIFNGAKQCDDYVKNNFSSIKALMQ
jgi:hypothetical protein